MRQSEFHPTTFIRYQDYLYSKLGIRFTPEKTQMIKAKIDRVKNSYEINNYDEFLDILKNNEGSEFWHDFIHEITTHKTDFFREVNHFNYLKKNINFLFDRIPRIRIKNEIRIWSAGCSTGEEPYTLAMLFKEIVPQTYVKILATDVSKEALQAGVKAVYPKSIKTEMTPFYLSKYFVGNGEGFVLKDEIKNMVTFRQFNLMNSFPFKKSFDIIFCRNVMIYFSTQVIEILLEKFYENLTQNGLLFIGHSESLINKKHSFKYIQPTIYQK